MSDLSNIERKLGEISEWQHNHQEDDDNAHKAIEGRFDAVDSTMSTLVTKKDIEQAVSDALTKFFFSKGVMAKNVLLTTAIILGALAVIGGAGKWLLGLIGFSYIK